jgi:iron complex transport system ATP-binding protein
VITLELAALEFGYGKPLFMPMDFCCGTGELTAVLGSNGRGKTTLLHTIAGMMPRLSGTVRAPEKTGFVPQHFTSHYAYTVLDIVLMGRVSLIKQFDLPSKKDEANAREALLRLGIADLAGRPYNTLSGGQRQLVLIARALATKSTTLVLDEPTSALDMQNQGAVLKLLKELAKDAAMNILFTTHEPTHALLIADKTLLLMPDMRWLFGETEKILNEENLMSAYGIPIKCVPLSLERATERAYRSFIPVFDV